MTAELSAARRQILITACERKGGLVLPITSNLKGGALKKVLTALLTRGAIEEVLAAPKQDVWRTDDEGVTLALKVTKTGCEVVGAKRKNRAGKPVKAVQRERSDTKQAKVIAMLKRPPPAPRSSRSPRRPTGSPTRCAASSPERSRSGSESRSRPTRGRRGSGCTGYPETTI